MSQKIFWLFFKKNRRQEDSKMAKSGHAAHRFTINKVQKLSLQSLLYV